MITRNTLTSLLLLLFIFQALSSDAQYFVRKKARKWQKPPKAILVELHTYPRTANYFKEKGNTAKLNSLKTAVDSVNKRMVMDFNDNFSYCPVYYFIDTNMQQVLARKFEGILLDTLLNPVTTINLAVADTNYNIIYFGQPHSVYPETADRYAKTDLYDSDHSTQLRSRKRLVVLNHRGKPVTKKVLSEANTNTWAAGLKRGRYYFYKSKDHDIYYAPYAKEYSNKLNSYYGPYPYNR